MRHLCNAHKQQKCRMIHPVRQGSLSRDRKNPGNGKAYRGATIGDGLLEFAVDGTAADAKQASGLGLVAPGFFQSLFKG